jgi:hypothetical protein
VLELSDRPAGMLECLEVIEEELCSELFIIVHNLDGPMLRSNKSQDVLSRLAKMEHIHMVASIDHINAPLSKFYLFRFCNSSMIVQSSHLQFHFEYVLTYVNYISSTARLKSLKCVVCYNTKLLICFCNMWVECLLQNAFQTPSLSSCHGSN